MRLMLLALFGLIFGGCDTRSLWESILLGFLPQYDVHLLTHEGLDTLADVSLLAEFDDIIVGLHTFPYLSTEHYRKTALYWDIWACSYYDSTDAADTWQPGPGDWGDPLVIMEWSEGRGTNVYTWTGDGNGWPGEGPATLPDSHVMRFVSAVVAAQFRYPEISRIFLDDWSYNRFWWSAPDSLKELVWPGYPDETYLANQIRLAERMIRDALVTHRPAGWKMIGNGPACELSTTVQFHEHAGYGHESWDRLLDFTVVNGDTIPVDPHRFIWPGSSHFLMINAALVNGGWSEAGAQHFDRAVQVALAGYADISIGLCFESNPYGSVYSCFEDPTNWPQYYPEDSDDDAPDEEDTEGELLN